jgi:hypothetical protein
MEAWRTGAISGDAWIESNFYRVPVMSDEKSTAGELRRIADEADLHQEYDAAGALRDAATTVEALEQRVRDLVAAFDTERARLEEARDVAYLERNQLVSLLSKLFPAGLKRTAIEGWDPAWHNCVFLDLPTGQASWHFHDREEYLFAHLGPYAGEWDGHTTGEKYARIEMYPYKPPIPPALTEAELRGTLLPVPPMIIKKGTEILPG